MLYNNGTEVASLKFSAVGTDKLSWFSQENLVQSPWTDLKVATDLQTFSINGVDRIFEINGLYVTCSADHGWLLIPNSNCPWETRLPQTSIIYSKLDTFVNWNQYGMELAVVFTMLIAKSRLKKFSIFPSISTCLVEILTRRHPCEV